MIIFRYLAKEVYATLLATTFVLILIFISNQFIHYLSQAATGGLPVKAVMKLMSLQVPLLLGYMLPLGLFLGIMLAYGRLYVDNEMTVMAACGLSRLQLLNMTLGFSFIVAMLVALLMLWLEPHMAWYRDHIFAEAAVASPIETIFPRRFQTIGDGKWVVYVGDVSRDRKELQDVFVAHIPDTPALPWTVVSAAGGHASINPTTQDQFINLTKGYRYLGIPGHKDFQVVQYDLYGVRIQPGKLHMKNETEVLPTLELWQKRHSDRLAATELQWRFAMPIAAFILAFLAVPLSQIRPRRGRYAKILPALLIYIVYADLILVSQAAVENSKLAPFPGLLWVHSGMLLLAFVLTAHFLGWLNFKKIFS